LYDARKEAREFVGETRAEAVTKACGFFGREESGLAISEVAGSGVAGLASRVAIVAVPAAGRPAARAPKRPATAAESEEGSKESIGSVQGELSEIGRFLLGLVERLEVGSFEIAESQDGDHLVLQVRGPAALKLTGGEARGVSAIQLLANQVAMRQGEEYRRVIVDVESRSEKRIEYLERVAERAARRAKESGRGVALEPMNPRDRRTVHVTLRQAEGVATMSVGEGRYRQVVVVPEGAPEYKDAVRYEAAAREEEF
jgi:spoIIIJ-associated protein